MNHIITALAVSVALLFSTLSQADIRAPAVTTPEAIVQAYQQQRSDLMVEISGRVNKLLKDDNKGSRHQRFLLRLTNGHTLLVAHNIDLAPRAPLNQGDQVTVRGEYEWNDKGGVLHWTHHDPRGKHPGGWIQHNGQRYQ